MNLTDLSRNLGYDCIPNSLRRSISISLDENIIIKQKNKKYKLNTDKLTQIYY